MRKLTALLLTITLFVGVFVMPASAAGISGTSGSMTVSYSVQSSYLINLPDLTVTNDVNTFDLTADYVHIAQGKTLQISIDKTQTLTNGKFMMLTNPGTSNEGSMECTVYISNSNSTAPTIPYYLSGSAGQLLANFEPETTTPAALGRITLTPIVTSNTKVGIYTGRIYYIIAIV